MSSTEHLHSNWVSFGKSFTQIKNERYSDTERIGCCNVWFLFDKHSLSNFSNRTSPPYDLNLKKCPLYHTLSKGSEIPCKVPQVIRRVYIKSTFNFM